MDGRQRENCKTGRTNKEQDVNGAEEEMKEMWWESGWVIQYTLTNIYNRMCSIDR